MENIQFTITKGDYITLQDILKFENLVYSGGEAKSVILDGMVKVKVNEAVKKGDLLWRLYHIYLFLHNICIGLWAKLIMT